MQAKEQGKSKCTEQGRRDSRAGEDSEVAMTVGDQLNQNVFTPSNVAFYIYLAILLNLI